MPDQIVIKGITGVGHHGVLPSERAAGQEFVVDVVLGVDTRPAAEADDLSLTVDYASVAGAVHEIIVGEPVDLIETLAQQIADVCLSYRLVSEVEVVVHKPYAPIEVPFDDVELRIRRRA